MELDEIGDIPMHAAEDAAPASARARGPESPHELAIAHDADTRDADTHDAGTHDVGAHETAGAGDEGAHEPAHADTEHHDAQFVPCVPCRVRLTPQGRCDARNAPAPGSPCKGWN